MYGNQLYRVELKWRWWEWMLAAYSRTSPTETLTYTYLLTYLFTY